MICAPAIIAGVFFCCHLSTAHRRRLVALSIGQLFYFWLRCHSVLYSIDSILYFAELSRHNGGGAFQAVPELYPPGGGRRTAAQAAGSGLSSRKIEKETKRTKYYLICIDNHLPSCYTNLKKAKEGNPYEKDCI